MPLFCHVFGHILTPFWPFFYFEVVLSTDVKDGKTRKWAGTVGPLFKNTYASAEKGQLKFTGLTEDGQNKYDEYLEQVRQARQDPIKRKFERDHLTWYKAKHGIVLNDYEAEMERRNNLTVKVGIARDKPEEENYDGDYLFSDSDGDDDGQGEY